MHNHTKSKYQPFKKPLFGRLRLSLSVKIALLFTVVGVTVSLLIVIMGYSMGYSLLKRTIEYEQGEIAMRLAASVAEIVRDEVEDIEVYMSNPTFLEALQERLKLYGAMTADGRNAYLKTMDERWIGASANDPLVNYILDSTGSLRLNDITQIRKDISEIFIADKYGGLVAASGMTSDFYQADEAWWQNAYNEGAGKIFIDEFQFDDSSKAWVVPIAVPFKSEAGEVLGVCKTAVKSDKFFSVLARVSIGKTGHATLYYNSKDLYLYPAMINESGKETRGSQYATQRHLFPLVKLVSDIIRTVTSKDTLSSFSQVELPYSLAEDSFWVVSVEREKREVYAPLGAYLSQGFALIGALFFILLFSGFFFGKTIARPILALKGMVDTVDLYDLQGIGMINTGDEIESLAFSFNKLLRQLSETLVSRDILKKVVIQREQAEEKLNQTLKDELKYRKIMTSMLEDNNTIRERLEDSLKKLKATQDQLIHAEKMETVGRIASSVAHETKNPLGIILQGINYLEGTLQLEQEDNREILHMMKDSVKRADNIVCELLDFSRKRVLEIKLEDIGSAIESSIALVQHKLGLLNIKLVRELEKGLPKVMIDKEKIEQVFVNLFNNALDAMSKGGTLFIRSYLSMLDKKGDKIGNRDSDIFRLGEKILIVEIEDTGIGMDEDVKEKIFDPFFTTKAKTKGTGLGLSVSKNIIDMHGSLIKAESKKGKGTKFTITFKIPEGI